MKLISTTTLGGGSGLTDPALWQVLSLCCVFWQSSGYDTAKTTHGSSVRTALLYNQMHATRRCSVPVVNRHLPFVFICRLLHHSQRSQRETTFYVVWMPTWHKKQSHQLHYTPLIKQIICVPLSEPEAP